jgi:hypothetical protein
VTHLRLAQQLTGVDGQLAAVRQTLASQDFAGTFAGAAEADRRLDALANDACRAIWPECEPGASPIPADWPSLADVARVAAAVRSARVAAQPFPAGDFENLEELLSSGWRRQENAIEAVESAVRLSPTAPASGKFSLELEAKSKVAGFAPPAVPGSPVWITSPPLTVPPGHLVEIAGYARVDEIPIGSADPLEIFDSLGGEGSAVRLSVAPSWTSFHMVRAAPDGGECRLTIALGGVGKAHVDSLRYRFIPMGPSATAAPPAR